MIRLFQARLVAACAAHGRCTGDTFGFFGTLRIDRSNPRGDMP